ncbi:MAG: hypothetical protein WC214_04415 [Candidatus Omnitrophota bacterium]
MDKKMCDKISLNKLRKNWLKPEIIRIKLKPEQAVLSCCDSAGRANTFGEIQCWAIVVDCNGSYSSSS